VVDSFFRNAGLYYLGQPLQLVSGGIIPLANIAIMLKVGAGLFAIFLALGASRFVMRE
jgi:multisubunit Na+/H+ antiporter MnhB subunit